MSNFDEVIQGTPFSIFCGKNAAGEVIPMLVDNNGKLYTVTNDLGWYATPAALRSAHPTASDGNFAIVGSTDTVWVWDTDTTDWIDTAGGGLVTSVFGRTGAVTAQANDYTWGQIDKTVSDIADITTKSHTSLTDKGTNTHAQIDTHIGSTSNPHSVSAAQAGAAPAAEGVTNGDSHDHTGGAGAQIDHGDLDLDDGTNPHSTTKSDVGLGNVTNDAQVKKIGSSTDNALMRWDGVGGDTPQNASATEDDDGVLQVGAHIAWKTQTIAYAASMTPNANSGNAITIGQLTGSPAMNAMTNQTAGMPFYMIITVDGTDRTVTWNANYYLAGGASSTLFSANTRNVVSGFSDGSNIHIMSIIHNFG